MSHMITLNLEFADVDLLKNALQCFPNVKVSEINGHLSVSTPTGWLTFAQKAAKPSELADETERDFTGQTTTWVPRLDSDHRPGIERVFGGGLSKLQAEYYKGLLQQTSDGWVDIQERTEGDCIVLEMEV